MAIAVGSGRTSGDLPGVCLNLWKLLITCCKSENYSTSLKCSGAVVKGSVWRLMIQLSTTPGIPQQQWALIKNKCQHHHPPSSPHPPTTHHPTTCTNTPVFQCIYSLSLAAPPDSVYSGQDQLSATARIHSQQTDFWPIFPRSEKFRVLWILKPVIFDIIISTFVLNLPHESNYKTCT